MKKILTISVMMMAGIASTNAQVQGYRNVLIGGSGGFGASMVGNMPAQPRFMPSGYVGGSVIAFSSEYVAWGGQLNVSAEGYKIDHRSTLQTVRPLYLRMPLYGYFFAGDRYSKVRPYLHFGPSFAVKLAEFTTAVATPETKAALPRSFNQFDLGLDAGVGLNVQVGKRTYFNAGIKYYESLIDVITDKTPRSEEKHNENYNIALNVGVYRRINK